MVKLTEDQSYQNAATMLLNAAAFPEVTKVIYLEVALGTVKLRVMVSMLRTPGHVARDREPPKKLAGLTARDSLRRFVPFVLDLAAEGLEVAFDTSERFDHVFLRRSGLGQSAQFLHGRNDDADEEVQHGEGGNDDEGNKEERRPRVDLHDVASHVGPAFQSQDLEQGEEAAGQSAEPFRELPAEKIHREDGRGVEKDDHEQQHAAESGDGMEERGDHFAQAGDHGEQAQNPQHA